VWIASSVAPVRAYRVFGAKPFAYSRNARGLRIPFTVDDRGSASVTIELYVFGELFRYQRFIHRFDTFLTLEALRPPTQETLEMHISDGMGFDSLHGVPTEL
jgi:hypothetical protein